MMGGDSARALKSYRQGQVRLEHLVASDPQNAQVGVELANTYAKVGHALSQQGNSSAAITMFAKARATLEPMARGPQHTEARSGLACTHIWTGELLARRGKISEALEHYRKGAADYLSMVTQLPWDRYDQAALAASHGRIGDMLLKQRRTSEAATQYQTALEIAKRLALAKPSVLPWYTVADAYFGLGELSRISALQARTPDERRQHWSEARSWYQQSADSRRQIPNPGVVTSAGFEAANPTQAIHALAQCDAEITKLPTSQKRESTPTPDGDILVRPATP